MVTLYLIFSTISAKRKRPRSLNVDPDISEDYEPVNPRLDNEGRFEFEQPEDIEEKSIPYNEKTLEDLVHSKMDEKSEDVLEEEEKVEFQEEVNDQIYLMYITYEDRNYLDLFNFDKQLKNSAIESDDALDYNCPKMLYRSMGLQGYFNPILKDGGIEDCPNLELNCCTNQDFEELDSIWEDSLRPSTEAGHFYLEYYVKTILQHVDIYKVTAENLMEIASDRMCLSVAQSIIDYNVTQEMIDKTISLLAHVKEYDIQVKKSYPCLVCNHENIQYFDFKNRLLGLKGEVCLDIVTNLLEFYNHYNTFFWKYYNSLYFLAKCVDDNIDIEKQEEEKLEAELEKTEEEIHENEPEMKSKIQYFYSKKEKYYYNFYIYI